MIVARVPAGVRRDEPLARLTTVRTGGSADFFAVAETAEELLAAVRFASVADIPICVVGSGSNLLVADDGVEGLVVKLAGDLARIEPVAPAGSGEPVRSGGVVCGGGARLPQVAARAAVLGLGGIEFGISIPGTVGGAVRMNANAYGGSLAAVIERVEIVSREGHEERRARDLGFAYRRSNLRSGEVVARAHFRLEVREPGVVKERLRELRARRRESQPVGIKTFGSTFKNPGGPAAAGRTAGQLLDAAGCRGLRLGGARFSPAHANFVENCGEATTADVLDLMVEGSRRVLESFGVAMEPEVQLVGRTPWPAELARPADATDPAGGSAR